MKIGKINIDSPLILAPMENVTDKAFRINAKNLGADILFTEFISCEALIRDVPKAIKKAEFSKKERPIAVQIVGYLEESMQEATKIIEEFKPDIIDINCGCWARKHVARGEGAGLLRDLNKFESIVKSVVKSTKIPVTVKTRLGWDKDNIVICDVAKMVEAAGAKALTVHCRTRCQGYKGNADYSWLSKIKKVISIPLIGNGDVVAPQDSKRLFDLGCDGVMIGRGAVSNPWIFMQTKHFLKTGKELPEISIEDRVNLCIKHLKTSVKVWGEKKGVFPFRKYYMGYLKGLNNVSKLRKDLMQLEDLYDIIALLKKFLKDSSN